MGFSRFTADTVIFPDAGTYAPLDRDVTGPHPLFDGLLHVSWRSLAAVFRTKQLFTGAPATKPTFRHRNQPFPYFGAEIPHNKTPPHMLEQTQSMAAGEEYYIRYYKLAIGNRKTVLAC